MLLNEAFQEFLFDCQSRGMSDETVKNYEVNLRFFFRYIIEKKDVKNVEDITQRHIKEFIISRNKKGYEESYINTTITVLRAFVRYMYQEGYIFNELEVKNIKTSIKVIETFTDEEISKLLQEVKKGHKYTDFRNYVILSLMIDTGVRCNEVIQMKHRDVKENNTILIHGKGKKERYVPFSPALAKLFMKYERMKKSYFLEKASDYETYFLTHSGEKISRFILQQMMKDLGKKANIDLKKCFPHNLRHYFAVASLKNGLDLYSVSRCLGHSDIKTTTIYSNSIRDEEIQELSLKSSPLMKLIGGRR